MSRLYPGCEPLTVGEQVKRKLIIAGAFSVAVYGLSAYFGANETEKETGASSTKDSPCECKENETSGFEITQVKSKVEDTTYEIAFS